MKKFMKKGLSLILTVSLAMFMLVGCNSKGSDSSSDSDSKIGRAHV